MYFAISRDSAKGFKPYINRVALITGRVKKNSFCIKTGSPKTRVRIATGITVLSLEDAMLTRLAKPAPASRERAGIHNKK